MSTKFAAISQALVIKGKLVVVVGLPPEVSSRPPRQDDGRPTAPRETPAHRPAPPLKIPCLN